MGTANRSLGVEKVKRINRLDSDSFFGLIAALFLLLVYNFYLFQAFFAISESAWDILMLVGVIWFVIFFMVQEGILKAVGHSFRKSEFIVYSPVKSLREAIRFGGAIVFFIIFVAFIFGYYPLKMYDASIVNQLIFYVVSFGLSAGYWKYVESYKEGSVQLKRLNEYTISEKIIIIFTMFIFGGVALVFPYTIFGVIASGIWVIMLSRLMLEDNK